MEQNYDIIVIGGGTSGCACAWMAAKLGLKTLLIEKKSYLGGAITSQLVVPAMKTDTKELNTEFFNKLIKEAHKKNAQITYEDGNKGWFNPLLLPNILKAMLIDEGVKILNDSYCETIHIDNINKENFKILSLCIVTNHSDNITSSKNVKIFSKYFVDATGDANFSAQCDAKFLPKEEIQAMSLRFILAGVNKKIFADWLLNTDKDRNTTTACVVEDDIHLSTAYTWDNNRDWALKPFFDDAVDKDILKDSDRAYFQVFTIAGEPDKIAFNCPRIISKKAFTDLTCEDIIKIKKDANMIINRLLAFCKTYFPGFENAYICKVADELGVRESRRVSCQYTLTKEDIYNAKNFTNPVAFSNYPIDIHSVIKDASTLNYVQKTYSVPLESLIVKGFDNLFTVGRCLGADFYAQAAVRIQPTCFSMGEGVAKHIAQLIKNNQS